MEKEEIGVTWETKRGLGMRTVAVANQKGGCGKTTTAINVSAALSAAGRKTLLIDLDPQAHASFGLGANKGSLARSAYNLLTTHPGKRQPLSACTLSLSSNFDIVPAHIQLSTLEQEFKDKEDAVSTLSGILSPLRGGYAYVILDCPPSLGFLTFNALRAADRVLIPIDMSAFTLMGVGKLLGMLELLKEKTGHAPRVNALATLYDKRTKHAQEMIEEIKSFFGERMLQTVIRPNVALKQAVSGGVSIIDFDKTSNGAQDYSALSNEILRVDHSPEAEEGVAPWPSVSPREEANGTMPWPMEVEKAVAPGAREVTFKIDAPSAKGVFLAGDFNGWKINAGGMLSVQDSGSWEKRVVLPPGRYRYKFWVDGEWLLDSQNPQQEQNVFGSLDSVLNI
jgi:chromosome partitioning protein